MRSYKSYKEVKKECGQRSLGFTVYKTKEAIRYDRGATGVNQTQLGSMKESVKKALEYFGVKKSAKPIVVVAGFTGDFARAVRAANKGGVIFTDIYKPWVRRAKEGVKISNAGKKEVRAKPMKGCVMDLEKPHIDDRKVSSMISFEPTSLGEGFNKTVLPNLGSPNGFIIATGSDMFDYSAPNSWASKTNLRLFKTYGVQARMMTAGGEKKITFMQFKIPEERRKDYLFDRECYESIKYKGDPAGAVAKRLDAPQKRVMEAYRRYNSLAKK